MGRKLACRVLLLLACLPCASPVLAQTTGTVIGVVIDASTSEPVEGAMVAASSPSLQGEQTVLTDASGNYRLTLLPPGQYAVVFQLDGYLPFEQANIGVSIDKMLRVDAALVPETVEMEEVVVRTHSPPVVNIGSAETGMILRREHLSSLPSGPGFDSLVLTAPGTSQDRYGTGMNGASSPENSFLLEGLNVTDPAFGTFGTINGSAWMSPVTGLLSQFVDQVDVKTGNFLPEYGRATGGIVSALAKSGSNEFHGSIFASVTPYALSPRAKSVSRNGEAISNQVVQNRSYQAYFGAELGGPIAEDRLWFYLGFAPILYETTYNRYLSALQEDPTAPGSPLVNSSTGLMETVRVPDTDSYKVATQRDYQLVGKLTYQPDPDHTLTTFAYFEPTSQKSYVAAGTAQGPTVGTLYQGTDSARFFEQSGHALDLVGRYSGKLLERRLILEAQIGLHQQKNDTNPETYGGVSQADTPHVWWMPEHSLSEFENVPAQCQDTASFRPCPVTNYRTGGVGVLDDSLLTRYAGKVSATGLFEALGHHAVKAGVDLEHIRYGHTLAWTGRVMVLEQDIASLGGPVYSYIRNFTTGPVTSFDDPDGFTFRDALQSTTIGNNRAFYLQDSWAIGDRVTLNGGIRWETQEMWGASGRSAGLTIDDNIAPRIQAVYDFTGNGRGKISASWGRFYETIPLDLADRAFASETSMYANLAHCVEPSSTVGGSPASCPIISNSVWNGQTGSFTTLANSGGTTTPIAPDLKGQYLDQFGANVEYEVLPDLAVGFSYLGTRLRRVVEDISTDDGSTYMVINPGESRPFYVDGVLQNTRVATVIDPKTLRQVEIEFPKPERKYDAFTLEVRKNLSSHWLGMASYTYSSLRGNYPGLFSPEYGNTLNPNMGAEYDLVGLLQNRDGPLPADRPHQFKLYGAYMFEVSPRVNITLGGAFRAMTGVPVSATGANSGYGPGMSFIVPRGAAGRTPPITQFDLRSGLDYAITPKYILHLTIDVFNVLNQQTATSVDNNYTYDVVEPISNATCKRTNGVGGSDPIAGVQANCPDLAYARTIDGRPITVNKNYGRATSYQAPMSFRFGASLSF